MTAKTIGFIGLGRMGGGMALIQAGAVAGVSPAELSAQCELIFLCLPFSPEVRDTIFGSNGIAGTQSRCQTIVDTTTLDRSDALAFAEEAARTGIDYWDCPVSGMPFRAADGTLTVMFGGTEPAFDSIRPYLDCLGEFIIHCGAIGSGQAMKAINNVIYDVNIAALCEMLPLAKAIGLDTDAVAKVVTSASGRSFASEYFVPRMLERRFDSDFAMGDAFKDIVNVQKMAIETQAMLPVVNAMVASYQAAMAAGFADQPKSAILKVYENALGVKFENEQS